MSVAADDYETAPVRDRSSHVRSSRSGARRAGEPCGLPKAASCKHNCGIQRSGRSVKTGADHGGPLPAHEPRLVAKGVSPCTPNLPHRWLDPNTDPITGPVSIFLRCNGSRRTSPLWPDHVAHALIYATPARGNPLQLLVVAPTLLM